MAEQEREQNLPFPFFMALIGALKSFPQVKHFLVTFPFSILQVAEQNLPSAFLFAGKNALQIIHCLSTSFLRHPFLYPAGGLSPQSLGQRGFNPIIRRRCSSGLVVNIQPQISHLLLIAPPPLPCGYAVFTLFFSKTLDFIDFISCSILAICIWFSGYFN